MVFEFQMGRGRAGPKRFLEGFKGILQTDGYIAYEKVGGPKMVHAGWRAHARRGLFEAHELAPGETVAKTIVERIDDLFAIERAARENGCDLAARHRLRAEHAPELLHAIQEQLKAAQQQALPASKLGRAVAYVLGQWPRLEIFLQYPQLALSNNLAENSMRGVAIGRKNWIHIGSPTAGPRVAAILSIIESCRRLRIPIREYLMTVLTRLGRHSHPEAGGLHAGCLGCKCGVWAKSNSSSVFTRGILASKTRRATALRSRSSIFAAGSASRYRTGLYFCFSASSAGHCRR